VFLLFPFAADHPITAIQRKSLQKLYLRTIDAVSFQDANMSS